MRELAWVKIEQHPLVGQGYAVNQNEMWGIAGRKDLHMFTLLTLALGSSWHNTWLGIWADFGLPAVLFWAIFLIQAVVIGFWVYRRTLHGSAFRTLGMMILLYFIGDILRSWTGGHSANDPFTRWWMYGVLLSLALGLEQTKDRNVTDSGSPRRTRFGEPESETNYKVEDTLVQARVNRS
jgi:O-antigen ligase